MPSLQEQPPIPGELRNPLTTVTIRADSQQKVKDTYKLQGHVEVTYRDMRITAGEATYNDTTGDVLAQGHVTFTDPKAYLEADQAEYNIISEKGQFSEVAGYVRSSIRNRPHLLVTENPFYLRASQVKRLDEDTYEIDDGRVSSCEDEAKGWSLAVHRARLTVGDKVVTYGDVFRLLRAPAFYAPVLVHSISRSPRQTGFLLPQIGNSGQKGVILGQGFFLAINPSVDLLLGAENFSKRGPAAHGQFRARPSQTSEVTADYFGVHDRGIGFMHENRAPGQSVHASGKAKDLGYGFRGVADVDYITSLAFRLTFTDNFTQAVSSEAHQTGFLTKDFDAYSMSLYVSRYQDFLSTARTAGNSISIRQTPSFSFSGIDKQVGQSPFYFAFDASASGVARSQPGFATPELSERLDFHPELSLQPKPLWGFRFTPTVGARATRYGPSLLQGRGPLTRLLGEFSADLRPPSFERVFSRPYRHHRLKHVIEPDIRYRLARARDTEDITDIVRFDESDILAETNEIEYSLTNTLFTRLDVAEDQADKPQARELFSLRLSQKYYFDPTFGGALQPGRNVWEPTISLTGFAFAQGRRLSPLVSVLKFAPFSNYDTELRADFNPSGGGVLNAGITSQVRRGPFGLALTDFFVNRTAALPTSVVPSGPPANVPSFNLLRTVVSYGDASRKGLNGALGLDYNFAQGIAHQVVSQVSYNFGCFGLDFGYRRFALGVLRRENQFRVALSLANVGSFGNLRSRDRLYR